MRPLFALSLELWKWARTWTWKEEAKKSGEQNQELTVGNIPVARAQPGCSDWPKNTLLELVASLFLTLTSLKSCCKHSYKLRCYYYCATLVILIAHGCRFSALLSRKKENANLPHVSLPWTRKKEKTALVDYFLAYRQLRNSRLELQVKDGEIERQIIIKASESDKFTQQWASRSAWYANKSPNLFARRSEATQQFAQHIWLANINDSANSCCCPSKQSHLLILFPLLTPVCVSVVRFCAAIEHKAKAKEKDKESLFSLLLWDHNKQQDHWSIGLLGRSQAN